MIKERIVLAPGANSTELLRSLALYGQGCFAMRVYSSAYSLVEDMLTRKGILNGNVVSDAEAQYMINCCMKNVEAFKNASFTDALNIANSIKTLRNLIVSDEKSQMEKLVTESGFARKNQSLLELYDLYRKMLAGRKDRIDVIREALNNEYDLNCEFIKLKEFPLTPLEEALLNKLSNSVREMELSELFGVEDKPYENITYVKAYGNSNEVENVLNHIFENNIHLDDCVIAVSDTRKYNQLLLEYSQKYDLDVTFANGISINNTNPAKLLRLYYEWDINGYHGVDPLMNMIYSSYFNMEKLTEKLGEEIGYSVIKNTIDRAGQLKFEPDLKKNKAKAEKYTPLIGEKDGVDPEVIRVLAEELGRDCVSFINEYAIVNNTNDEEALRIITNGINEYLRYRPDGHYSDIYVNLLAKNVGRSVSREGCLIVTDIRGALSVCRKNLFVIGLSANNFPGTVRENYLLLDEDLQLYGDNVPLSTEIIERKKNDLYNLLSLYSALNANISLSYSCYDMTGIKEENASSVLFEIYQKQNPSGTIGEFEEILKKGETSYLQNRLSVSHQILSSLKSDQVLVEIPEGDIVNQPYEGRRTFSPSALELFFSCKKRFYLSNILGIEEPDPDEPFTVIDARDMGTLVHSVMEYYADNPGISESEFTKQADKMFNDFLKTRTPINDESAKAARKEFMNMAVNGYRNDPGNKVIAAEEKFSVMNWASGIGIYGYPDRVEVDKNGKYLIADYKTKRRYEHVEDDINTCLQVVLYAYMMSHRKENRLPISYCTYRYLRYSTPVNCVYNSDMERQLNEKLMEVKDTLDSGYFPCAENEENCKYCKFASICGKDKRKKVSEDE